MTDFSNLEPYRITVIKVTMGTLTLDLIVSEEEVPGIKVTLVIYGTIGTMNDHKLKLEWESSASWPSHRPAALPPLGLFFFFYCNLPKRANSLGLSHEMVNLSN